ncbi:hypothetical protein GXW82_10625 [Streptacidiphilus sp. 4-A2]|nr:hypothetical protein [Streptacidiphilus sp. 4-A2]
MPVTISSTLMPNHVAGKPLKPQRSLAVAYSDTRSPILIALDDEHRLTVTLPSATRTTGWAQVDLTDKLAAQGGLGAAPAVQCFAVSQDSDGSIWLIVAAADAVGADSKLFLSRKLPNTAQEGDWQDFARGLVPRAVPAGNVFSSLVLGSADDTGAAPHAVGVAMQAGQMKHYQVNPDTTDDSWTCLPLVLPQNATRCLAAACGSLADLGRGVYALCELGAGVNLTFTTLPEVVGGVPITESRQLGLPAGFTAGMTAALAALPVEGGRSELYLSGDGLYRYSSAAQSKSGLPGERIADSTLFTGTAGLVVTGSAGHGIDAWALNSADLLVHTSGTDSGGAAGWQLPVRLGNEVTAFAAYRTAPADGDLGSAAMALGRSDGSLALLTRDYSTNLWRTRTVSLEQPDTALELQTYTTRITVTDADGVPLGGKEVRISSGYDVGALVNGQYMALKQAVAKPVGTDPGGVITIVLETDGVTAPTYTVTVDATSTPADPAQAVKTLLRGITDGTQIADARRSDGKPLFPDGGNGAACDVAAAGVEQLMKAYDDLAGKPPTGPARSRRTVRAADLVSSVGVRHGADGIEVLRGESALAARAAVDSVEYLSPGDLLAALWAGLESFGDWLVSEISSGWEFVVRIGKQFVGFFITVAEQAVAAADWVLRHTLGISLEDVVAWLGYVFDWSDILKNHKVIAHLIDLGLDWTVGEAGRLKDALGGQFDTVRSHLVGDRIVVDQSNEIFAERLRKAPAAEAGADDQPQSNWAAQQLGGNVGGITVQPVTISDVPGCSTT